MYVIYEHKVVSSSVVCKYLVLETRHVIRVSVSQCRRCVFYRGPEFIESNHQGPSLLF